MHAIVCQEHELVLINDIACTRDPAGRLAEQMFRTALEVDVKAILGGT